MATPMVAPAIDPTAHNIDDNVDPNDILNPSFIDLFLEEAPPQWTLADLQQLHAIRGQPPNVVAPFQKLPVELVEHIAHNLSAFRDIKALGSSCTFFRKILFESSNHLFWYKWSKAPHSLCRWDLGYYRQNRAYQNTIVNQQNGRRRKRCETCMARAFKGLAFKKKTCIDCWDDLGLQASELFFVHNIDISAVPREYVDSVYAPSISGYAARSEWDLLFFYKPGNLEKQLLATSVQVARESRPDKLFQFAQQTVRSMSGEIAQIKRSMGYRPSLYSYYNSGSNIRREKWYAENVGRLVCPAEVIQRMLEVLISQDIGEEWLDRGPYERIKPAEELYGPTTPIATGFEKVDCELQLEEEWKREFGEDLSNLHDCKIECHRGKRAEQFSKLWWPQAEKSFVDMLTGPKAIVLTDDEIGKLRPTAYSWQWREKMQKIALEILAACKWVVPGIRGEWTAETVEKWEKIHGTEGSEGPEKY